MGGSAQAWTVTLDDDLVIPSNLELNVALTKFGPPAVTIGWSVSIED